MDMLTLRKFQHEFFTIQQIFRVIRFEMKFLGATFDDKTNVEQVIYMA